MTFASSYLAQRLASERPQRLKQKHAPLRVQLAENLRRPRRADAVSVEGHADAHDGEGRIAIEPRAATSAEIRDMTRSAHAETRAATDRDNASGLDGKNGTHDSTLNGDETIGEDESR